MNKSDRQFIDKYPAGGIISTKQQSGYFMLPLPQHPIHYLFGSITHAPSVFEAWIHEKIEIKKALFILYTYFYVALGYISPEVGLLDLFGIYFMVTALMSIPIYIFSDGNSFLMKVSDSFFNGVLAYHAFFIFFFIVFNISLISSAFLGTWTINWNNTTLALGMVMLSGYSLQMAWTNSKKFPWSMVWFFSLLLGILSYWGFSQAMQVNL